MKKLPLLLLMLAIAGPPTCQPALAKPKRDEGPPLPYSCAMVRQHAAMLGFKRPPTPAQKREIAQLEKENSITPRQRRQAVACFKR